MQHFKEDILETTPFLDISGFWIHGTVILPPSVFEVSPIAKMLAAVRFKWLPDGT